MKRALKWIGIILAIVIIIGFLLFLYYIPPFTSMPQEEVIQPQVAASSTLDGVTDPRERLLAERGRYIVLTHDCSGCHTAGDSGPDYNKYLAGGTKHVIPGFATVVARNLTPDSSTGLGTRTDDEILAVLRSGVFHTGRLMDNRMMPWGVWSNWTEEDKRAVVVYLRHLKPVHNPIPDLVPASTPADSTGYMEVYGGDYSVKQ